MTAAAADSDVNIIMTGATSTLVKALLTVIRCYQNDDLELEISCLHADHQELR